MTEIIMFILAREGSQRLPRKNVMAYKYGPEVVSIVDVAIRRCLRFIYDKDALLIVNTDIDSIASKYRFGYGEKMRVMERELRFRGPEVNPVDILLDTIERTNEKDRPEHVILTQATSPAWEIEALETALKYARSMKLPGIFSVNPAYKPNGCFYIVRTKELLEQRTLFVERCGIYRMDWRQSLDIDNLWDMRAAQAVNEKQAIGYLGD